MTFFSSFFIFSCTKPPSACLIGVYETRVCHHLGNAGGLLPLLAVTLLCLRRRKARWMLYVGGGMLLLTALNIWNAHWIW